MKLRNKKTGEIMDDVQYRNYSLSNGFGFRMSGKEWEYHSLAELNEEWEDVLEEPKEYWYIAELCGGLQKKQDTDNGEDSFNKQIGNYFETEEEAEKAVEKLKAWKRLKDKGFRFCDWYASGYPGKFSITAKGKNFDSNNIQLDLDLLFGGDDGC